MMQTETLEQPCGVDECTVEIVLVEDNSNDAELIVRALRKQGLGNRIVWLKDGAEAVDFFSRNHVEESTLAVRPKFILLDLKLPKINGLEVLRELKQDPATKDIPVVVLTSSQEDRDLKAAYDAGANSYVQKPIVFTDFAKVVGELHMYWLLTNRAPTD